jgi:hypothetical protein
VRHYVLTAPFALLSSACVLRPWTPSVPDAYWAEAPSTTKDVITMSRSDAVALWQLPPDNPWMRYEKLTLLTSVDSMPSTILLPHVDDLEVVADARTAAEVVATVGLPPETMFVVDLRGAASVAFGSTLSRRARESVSPVLTFNNWPADAEMIPAEETLSALLTMTPRPLSGSETGDVTRPVFLLDAWRLAYRYDTVDDDVTDNRYMLNPSDLPSADVLHAEGIRRVVYVVESLDDSTMEEDDLNQIFLEYQAEGILVSMVDLDWLRSLADPPRWDSRLASYLLQVDTRMTLLTDPTFYIRARGGFGGPEIVPVVSGMWGEGGFGYWGSSGGHGGHGHGGG